MIRRTLLTLLVAASSASLAPAADAQRRDRDAYRAWIDTTIAFARGGTVDVGALAVDVVVETWERPEIRVRAFAERGRIETSLTTSRVSVRIEPEGDRRSGRTGDAHVQLVVPAGTRVRATTTAGDITISDTRGEIEASANAGDVVVRGGRGLATLRTLGGDLTAVDMDGDVAATTGIGDLVLTGVSGDVRATTVGGDLLLAAVTGRAVAARSTTGDVAFAGAPQQGGRYEFATHSGDVVLAIPADARADVSVQSYSGSLVADFPIVLGGGVGATRPRTFEFTIGGGGARIRVETFSGDVALRRGLENREGRGERRDRR